LPVIDFVSAEVQARFSDNSSTVMIQIQAQYQNIHRFFDYVEIAAFAQLYNCNIEEISIYQLKA
jgi:hypothetical protein